MNSKPKLPGELIKASPAFKLFSPEDRERYETLSIEEHDAYRAERDFVLSLFKRGPRVQTEFPKKLRDLFPDFTDAELTGVLYSNRDEFCQLGKLCKARWKAQRKLWDFLFDTDHRYLGIQSS
jgi:hypothetical protein